jgi:hypothetical protein
MKSRTTYESMRLAILAKRGAHDWRPRRNRRYGRPVDICARCGAMWNVGEREPRGECPGRRA